MGRKFYHMISQSGVSSFTASKKSMRKHLADGDRCLGRVKRRKPTKGYLFWRCEWYSICSVHFHHNPQCHMCTTGKWVNVTAGFFNHLHYKWFPAHWVKWANRNNKKT